MPQLSQPEDTKMDAALQEIYSNFNDWEKEQMNKKRKAAKILTEEKTKAFLKAFGAQASSEPTLMDILPGLSSKYQLTNAFHAWISQHIDRISASRVDKYQLAKKVTILKENDKDSLSFLQEWKMLRIHLKIVI